MYPKLRKTQLYFLALITFCKQRHPLCSMIQFVKCIYMCYTQTILNDFIHIHLSRFFSQISLTDSMDKSTSFGEIEGMYYPNDEAQFLPRLQI